MEDHLVAALLDGLAENLPTALVMGMLAAGFTFAMRLWQRRRDRSSVNNHAVPPAEADRWADALTASQEAVDLHRELAAGNRDAYLPGLAASVNNHAVRLAEAGRWADALTASQEAVDLHRELAAGNRDAYLPGLATSLWNVGYVACLFGHTSEPVIVAVTEGLEYFDELTAAEPRAFTARRDATAVTLARLHNTISVEQPAAVSSRPPTTDEAAADTE